MNIADVDQQTALLVAAGHRVLQIHRFASSEKLHVERLAQWAALPIGAKVLDMGSGTGEVARLMHSIRPDLQFTLVNISEVQLSYSPTEMVKHCGNFCNLPFSDDEYDSAMFCFSIGHESKLKALSEAARLVKSGGVVFVYDMVRVAGDNTAMLSVQYSVSSKSCMDRAANEAGLQLDFYMEPSDSGEYGKSVLGDAYATVFGGTIPAIWRFIKR